MRSIALGRCWLERGLLRRMRSLVVAHVGLIGVLIVGHGSVDRPVKGEKHLVDEAPPPFLAWFEAADDGMAGIVGMCGRVPIGGVVAAPDVAADHAETQVHPPVARSHAVLTSIRAGRDHLYLTDVRARALIHEIAPQSAGYLLQSTHAAGPSVWRVNPISETSIPHIHRFPKIPLLQVVPADMMASRVHGGASHRIQASPTFQRQFLRAISARNQLYSAWRAVARHGSGVRR